MLRVVALVALAVGAYAGWRWKVAHGAYAEWRKTVAAVPILRKLFIAHGRRAIGWGVVLVLVGLAALKL